jgi:hypothetical protein
MVPVRLTVSKAIWRFRSESYGTGSRGRGSASGWRSGTVVVGLRGQTWLWLGQWHPALRMNAEVRGYPAQTSSAAVGEVRFSFMCDVHLRFTERPGRGASWEVAFQVAAGEVLDQPLAGYGGMRTRFLKGKRLLGSAGCFHYWRRGC